MTRILSILLIAFCIVVPTFSAAVAETATQTKEKATDTNMKEQRPETGRSSTEPATQGQKAHPPEMGSPKEEQLNTLKGVDPAVK